MEDGESRAESPVLEKKATENHCSTFQIILSVAVVLLAIGGSFLFYTSEEDVPECGVTGEDDAQIPE